MFATEAIFVGISPITALVAAPASAKISETAQNNALDEDAQNTNAGGQLSTISFTGYKREQDVRDIMFSIAAVAEDRL